MTHFVDSILKSMFLNDSHYVLARISVEFVPKGLIENKLSFGAGNGMASNWWQAIIYTQDVQFLWWHHVSAKSALMTYRMSKIMMMLLLKNFYKKNDFLIIITMHQMVG